MSGLDRWLDAARTRWEALRVQLTRLTPAPVAPDQLASEDATARWRAVRALVQRPRADLLPQLLALTGDDDAMVRASAVDALVSWGPTVALESIRQALAQAPEPPQATALLEALARLPDPANRAAITPWLDHSEPGVRAAAFMALAALGEDDDLPVLRRALKTGDLVMQRAILAALCAPGAEDLAQRAASSNDPVLRQRGEQALARIHRAQTAQTTHPRKHANDD